ncbi:ANTAR domain-containing protein [Actinomadura sp. 21ATH]|uniref:ANTAR domain-containing protein n=1 Tax=Actinomadura sp. 21ATH TaxID=1735444 RepID=UPI0035C1158E
MFAFVLQVGGVRIGAVDFYRCRAGALTAGQAADGEALAGVAAAVAFSQHPVAMRLAEMAAGEPPFGFPPVVHQAAGVLAALLDVPVADALVRLRGYAFAHDEPIGDLARRVVERRLQPDGDPDSGS